MSEWERSRQRRWLAGAACAGLVVACNRTTSDDPLMGGQTGDGSGEFQPWPNSAQVSVLSMCTNDSEPVDDPSSKVEGLSFTAQDVLDNLNTRFDSTLLWAPSAGEYELSTSPEAGEGAVSLEISYRGGPIRRVFRNDELAESDGLAPNLEELAASAEPVEETPTVAPLEPERVPQAERTPDSATSGVAPLGGDADETPCPPFLEIVVRVRMSTPGGALDEQFDAVLTARDVDRVTFDATLPIADLAGELDVTTVPVVGDGPLALAIAGEITPYGTFGHIDAQCVAPPADELSPDEQTSSDDEADTFSCGTVAEWPVPGECAQLTGIQGTFPLGDRQGSPLLSLGDALEPFASLPRLPVHWRDGSGTELSITTNFDGAVCISAGTQGAAEDGLWYSLSVDASTADGRLDGEYDALVSAFVGRATLMVELNDLPSAEARPRTGLQVADFSKGEYANFSLILGWDEATGYWGDLSAWGFASSDECGPRTELERGDGDAGAGPAAGSSGPAELEQVCYVEVEGATIGSTPASDESTDVEP